MPREMKPIGAGRLDALKGMMRGEPEAPAPEGEGYSEGVDIPGMIEALEMEALPGADESKREHLEKAIAELKMCVGEKQAPAEKPMEEEPEAPAA